MPNKRVGAYTTAIKEQAALAYAIDGVMNKVAKDMDIPRTTLIAWSEKEWWDNIIDTVRHEKQQQHVATYTKIVDAAQKVVLDKIGESTASQASLIACQAQDKSLLLQGKATSISAKTETRQDLADQFRKLASDLKANTMPINVIDVTPSKGCKDDK